MGRLNEAVLELSPQREREREKHIFCFDFDVYNIYYVGISHIFYFFRLCECLASVLKVASLVPAPLHSQSHRFPWSCPQSDLRLKSIQMMLPYHI